MQGSGIPIGIVTTMSRFVVSDRGFTLVSMMREVSLEVRFMVIPCEDVKVMVTLLSLIGSEKVSIMSMSLFSFVVTPKM